MKKYNKILLAAIFVFFVSMTPVLAQEMTLEELSDEIEYKQGKGVIDDGTVGYVYVIGEYVFTSNHILKTQDVMLAARSIRATDTTGATAEDDIFGEMSIFSYERVFDDEEDVAISFEAKNNLVGTTAAPTDKVDVKYIDYSEIEFGRDTRVEVSLDTTEDDAYGEYLEQWFGGFANDERLTIADTGITDGKVTVKVTGSIAPFKDMPEVGFPENERTGYYFAYVTNVVGITDDVVLQHGDKRIIRDYFDTENGIVAIISLNPATPAADRKITFTVDADGSRNVYGVTTVEIDLSEVVLEKETAGKIVLNTTAHEYQVWYDEFNWTRNDSRLRVGTPVVDGNTVTYKLTGTIGYKDGITGFPAEELRGYYLSYAIEVDDVTDDVKIVHGNKTMTKAHFDTENGIAAVISLDPAKPAADRKITFVVDADGDKANYSPRTVVLDYTAVVLEPQTVATATVDEAKTVAVYKDYLTNTFNFENDSRLELDKVEVVDTENVTVKFKGTIGYNGDVTGYPEDEAKGYYLAYVLHVPNVTDDVTVDLGHGKVVGRNAFDTVDGIVIIIAIDPENETGKSKIVVDADGDGDLAPTTVTLDYSAVVLEAQN